jgi:prepilin-type N-terminal cleavage/methylation domain-containing protein
MINRNRQNSSAGFSLLEVLTALAVLGTAAFVLMGAHQSALRLFIMTAEEVDFRYLMEDAAGQAELSVYTGELSGGEEFGPLFPDYSWTFEATLQPDMGEMVQLYEVVVAVVGPDEEREIIFYLYDTGLGNDITGGLSRDTGSSRSNRSSSSSRSSSRGNR